MAVLAVSAELEPLRNDGEIVNLAIDIQLAVAVISLEDPTVV